MDKKRPKLSLRHLAFNGQTKARFLKTKTMTFKDQIKTKTVFDWTIKYFIRPSQDLRAKTKTISFSLSMAKQII